MNGGTDSTTLPGQTNDPAALLSTLMATASPQNGSLDKILPSGLGGDALLANAASNAGVIPRPVLDPVTGTPAGTLKWGIFGYGYYDDATGRFTAATPPVVPPVVPPIEPPVEPPVEPPPVVPPVVPPIEPPVEPPAEPPPIRPPRKHPQPGEGSVNEDARKRGEMLTAFLASFQAAFQRQNPNFNFARNPKLAKSLNLPWSGDIGR